MVNPLSPAEVAVCVQTEVRVRAVGRYLSQTVGAERVLQCLAVFRTGFGLSRFPALCALIPYSKPDGFLLANILSLETLPCREVHSCWDEFRATAHRSAMAHRSLSPEAVFIISLVFGGPWLCPIFHSSGDWKVIPSKLLVLETQDHFLPFSAFLSSFPIQSLFYSTTSSFAIVKMCIGREYFFFFLQAL